MESLPIITSDLLSRFPEIVFGMSTRRGGVSPNPLGMNTSFTVGDNPLHVNANRKLLCERLGIRTEDVVYQKQVHGTTVKSVREPGTHESCDALYTNTRGIYLTVSVADCLPILIYDAKKNAVAGVHAGWRGSRDKIVVKAVEALMNDFHSSPADLIAYIGPGAGTCCYEVGKDLAGEFDGKYLHANGEKKSHLDLKSVNRDLLMLLGVSSVNIEQSEHCTICNAELFHSHRRDKERSGRMMAVIGMKNRAA